MIWMSVKSLGSYEPCKGTQKSLPHHHFPKIYCRLIVRSSRGTFVFQRWKVLGTIFGRLLPSAPVADQIACDPHSFRGNLNWLWRKRGVSTEERKNSSELWFHSSEVSFHSSEVSYPVSVENKRSPPRRCGFPQWRLGVMCSLKNWYICNEHGSVYSSYPTHSLCIIFLQFY